MGDLAGIGALKFAKMVGLAWVKQRGDGHENVRAQCDVAWPPSGSFDKQTGKNARRESVGSGPVGEDGLVQGGIN